MDETRKKLTFRGGMFFSLVPVVIYVFFCVVLFIIFKAFNMEALAVGGFIALLVGGLFCTSYSEFWDSAVRGISSITSVSVVVILLLTGMFSQLIKICGLSGGFVWLANSFGIRGGVICCLYFSGNLHCLYGDRFLYWNHVYCVSDFLPGRLDSGRKSYVDGWLHCFRRCVW